MQGVAEPDVVWRKDGEQLYGTDQMFITLGEQHWETFHRWASQSAHTKLTEIKGFRTRIIRLELKFPLHVYDLVKV